MHVAFTPVSEGRCGITAISKLRLQNILQNARESGLIPALVTSEAELVPWSAVTEMYTWEYSGQKVLVLSLDPEVEKRLTLSRFARWSRGANTALGADGLSITAQGLTMPYDEMFEAAQAYWAAAGSR